MRLGTVGGKRAEGLHPIQPAVFFPAAKKLGIVKGNTAQADLLAGQIESGVGHIQPAQAKQRGIVFFILQVQVFSLQMKPGKGHLGGVSLGKTNVAT